MPTLLFKLKSVPEDESDEIRDLLSEAEIEFYETTAGHWGLSFEAIWLKNETELKTAKALIDNYQLQRQSRAHDLLEHKINSGDYPSRWQLIWHSPIRTIAVVIIVIATLYFSLIPFFISYTIEP